MPPSQPIPEDSPHKAEDDVHSLVIAKHDTSDTTECPSPASEKSDDDSLEDSPRQELGMVISQLQGILIENEKTFSRDHPEEASSEASGKKVLENPFTENTKLSDGTGFIVPMDHQENGDIYDKQGTQSGSAAQYTNIVSEEIMPPSPGIPPPGHPLEHERSSEDMELESYSDNHIAINKAALKEVKQNILSPREQEKQDEPMLRAIRHLFNNRFMKAKRLFEKQADSDPLYALGLGSMAFLKAVMTTNEDTTKNAIQVLMTTYNMATAQIDLAMKKSVGDSVVQYFSTYYNYIKYSRGNALPSNMKPASERDIEANKVTFVPNGVLRAHVVKAESCLQIAILQLLQESVVGYIKCGINLRRAYTSYSLVWQEYKRMGQGYNEFIDRDTVSGIQFGIGAVHLVLSALPQKTLRMVSAFGWKADKHLGFALLKICLEDRRVRSPMASLMLLAYYTVLTSLCPQILASEYTQPAIETLLDAQRSSPDSAFFLYFAGRTSRLARNLTLSTQSFMYAIEISKNEWAEVEVLQLCSYEIGFNYMMQHEWEEAANIFDTLYKEKYWSPVILRFLHGACLDMMGLRTEAILAFADVPELEGTKSSSTAHVEKYVLHKVAALQTSGYQDMDMTLCALEFICLMNSFDFMSHEMLDKSIALVDRALGSIAEAEKIEYGIRTRELLPDTPPPQYFDQRGTLLLLKASIYNALGRHQDSIIHLNWIIDHKEQITTDKWVVPFSFWEAGVTSWGTDNRVRAREFWDMSLKYSKYDFEYRLAMRLNLAITKAQELGVPAPEQAKNNGKTSEDMTENSSTTSMSNNSATGS
ncbi:hypothetical protein F4703DRAFT_1817470 [Phycomyces blakesleeanus]